MAKMRAVSARRAGVQWIIRVETTEWHLKRTFPWIGPQVEVRHYRGDGTVWHNAALGCRVPSMEPWLSSVGTRLSWADGGETFGMDPEVRLCTGIAAQWCPICGDCSCAGISTPEEEPDEWDSGCGLHGNESHHGDLAEFPPYGQVVT